MACGRRSGSVLATSPADSHSTVAARVGARENMGEERAKSGRKEKKERKEKEAKKNDEDDMAAWIEKQKLKVEEKRKQEAKEKAAAMAKKLAEQVCVIKIVRRIALTMVVCLVTTELRNLAV